MTILEDIQNSAVDPKSDLGTLLRKCRLLAGRLGSKPLEDWVVWESNGYPIDVEVPAYRTWPLQVRGHFFGHFGRELRNTLIPLECIPKHARDSYREYKCRYSIAAIESFLGPDDPSTVQVTTGDLALFLGTTVYSGFNCLEAWGQFGMGQFYEVTNAVRNRILNLAITLWKDEPKAGELDADTKSTLAVDRVTQVFNTTVYGGAANIAGGSLSSSIELSINAHDLAGLVKLLKSNGISESDAANLRAALEAEPTAVSTERFGPKVSAWISEMTGKAASGAWNIGLGAAGNLLAATLSKYYGLS